MTSGWPAAAGDCARADAQVTATPAALVIRVRLTAWGGGVRVFRGDIDSLPCVFIGHRRGLS